MPQVTVYIREEDVEKWKAIEKKAEFIHNALRVDELMKGPVIRPAPVDIKPIRNPKENPAFADKYAIILCKHGADPKFCKYAKPGKPCK